MRDQLSRGGRHLVCLGHGLRGRGTDESPVAWIYNGSTWSAWIAMTTNAGDTIGRLSCPSADCCAYVPIVGNTG